MIVVNSSTRQFNIPGADLVFGVTADSGSEVKQFQCPRYVGNNLDIASCFVRINYQNANGEIDFYLVKDVTVDGENVTFTWELSPKVTMYKGNISFVMCVVGPDTKVKWHTTLGRGQILEGLEPNNAIVEKETEDGIATLIAMVDAQTSAVEAEGANQVVVVKAAAKTAESDAVAQIEAKGTSTLATIPGEYTATVNAVQSAANAIRKKVSGEVIRVDDVSPMEHYPVVKISNRNMCEITGEFVSTVGVGGYYTPKRLTYAAPYIENGKTYVFTAETDDDLRNTVLSVVFYGLRASGATTLDSRSSPGVLRCVVTPSDFVRIDAVELRFNRIPSASATEERTITYRNIYFGLTDYEEMGYSYVDPTTVKVRRCGKNIFSVAAKSQTHNGVTFTVNSDGTISATGTATKATFIGLGSLVLKPGEKYRLSGSPTGSAFDTYVLYIHNNTTGADTYDMGEGRVFTGKEGDLGVTIAVYAGTTVNNLVFYPMVILGEEIEDFEPYNGETQIPSSDGTVSGLTAVSPTMTLLTDKTGVNIECEYSRDTNVVIAEILEKITALGG